MTNLETIKKFIIKLVNEKPEIKFGLKRVNDYLKSHYPDLKPPSFTEEELSSDQQEIKKWLSELLSQYPIPGTVKSVWFGIFEKVDGDKQTLCLYISGSRLRPEENESDWPTDTSYFPDGRYYTPKGLGELYDEVKKIVDSKERGEVEVIVIVSLVSLLLMNILPQVSDTIVTGNEELFVGAGYDEGDIVNIGVLTKHGWRK